MLLVCCVLFAQFVSTQALTLHAIKDVRAQHAVEKWGIEIWPGAETRLINLEIMRSRDVDLSNSGEPHSVSTRHQRGVVTASLKKFCLTIRYRTPSS